MHGAILGAMIQQGGERGGEQNFLPSESLHFEGGEKNNSNIYILCYDSKVL